jgi:hypothetical protein
MPNLITQYNNGTFEDLAATWSADIQSYSVSAYERSADFFNEGDYSGKLTLKALNNGTVANGIAYLLAAQFTFDEGDELETILKIRCNASVPDDAIFFLASAATNKMITKPVRASTAKSGWAELKLNNDVKHIAGQAQVQLAVCFDTQELSEVVPFTSPVYQAFYEDVLQYNASTGIPAGAIIYLDSFNAEEKAIPLEVNLQFEGRKLYYIKNFFRLIIRGTTVIDIREPIKWDDVNIEIEFDKKTKRYKHEFSDKDVVLQFDNRCGRTIIMQEYALFGVQADISLVFGEKNTLTGAETILYEGSFNFEEYSRLENVVECTIERRSFAEKLNTNFDVKVDLFRLDSLEGVTLPALATRELYLHPHLLAYEASYAYNKNVAPEQVLDSTVITGGGGDDPEFKWTVPPLKIKTNNIDKQDNNVEGLQEPLAPDGTLVYAGLVLPPGISKRRFYFNIKISFQFTMGNTSQFIKAGFAVYKKSNIASLPNNGDLDLSVIVDTENIVKVLDDYGNVAGTKQFSGEQDGYIDLLDDEAIFIKAFVYTPGNTLFPISDFVYTNITNHFMEVEEQTVFSPSLVNAPMIFEAIDKQLAIILDQQNVLKSNFLARTDLGYAVNGCGAHHFLMNGLMIRRIPGKPFPLSAKEWYNSLDKTYCMAMGIERDNEGNESVRFEPIEFFFRDILLMKLGVISDYKSGPASEYLFNELEFGFKKYPQDNQADSLQDFHTKIEFVTPLNKIKNKLSNVIDCIFSGYYIEYTRRESFNENPTNAYETDKDIFMIDAKVDTSNETNIIIDQAAKTITINGIFPTVADDQLIIITFPSGVNGNWTVESVDIPFTYDKTIITVVETLAPYDGPYTVGSMSVFNGAGRWVAKRDEDFDSISGLKFPKSVYNLQHHLKRIALRWAKVFQSGWAMFVEQGLNKSIRFTNGENNTEVTTKINPTSCLLGDSNVFYRKDGLDENINDMDKPLFHKDIAQFKAPLSWIGFKYILTAFEGNNVDAKDYGFFQWVNPDGVTEKGYALNLKFNPNTQICTFTCILKYDA